MFLDHSKNYRHIFDPSTGFMRGRNSDGQWLTPFDPIAWGGPYTEGDAWQWLWSVQQDVPGLIELLGGKEGFIRKLDGLFAATSDFKVGGYKQVIHEMTEAKIENMGQYAHVNEAVHHAIYLYDYAGQPWKAQKWIHEVEDRHGTDKIYVQSVTSNGRQLDRPWISHAAIIKGGKLHFKMGRRRTKFGAQRE